MRWNDSRAFFMKKPCWILGLFVMVIRKSSSQRTSTRSPEQLRMETALVEHEIIPTYFKSVPQHPIKVVYPCREVNFGNNFSLQEIEHPPIEVSWPVERKFERAKSRFIFGMFGPDLPTREVPTGEHQWQHWLIINIPGNKWQEGRVVTDYRGYEPFFIDDLHRVIFLVYRQKGKFPLIAMEKNRVTVNASDEERGYFSWRRMSDEYDLGEPYAINFMELNVNGSETIMKWDAPPNF